MVKGWICPVCGSVLSPFVAACPYCVGQGFPREPMCGEGGPMCGEGAAVKCTSGGGERKDAPEVSPKDILDEWQNGPKGARK